MKKKTILPVLSISMILVIVGAMFMLSGCDNKNNQEQEVPTGLSSIELDGLRIQLLSDTIVRIENEGPKGFEDRPSYIVPNRVDYDHVNYTVVENENETIIKTDSYWVYVPYGGLAEDTYITSPTGERLWTFSDAGETDTNVYLPSPSDELKSWYFTDNPRIIPSEYGYSFVMESGKLQEWDFESVATDAFVFLPQGDYKQFCSDYVKVTGQSEMVNLQMLGYWDSRWYAYSSETALQQIKDYTDRGYSIDVLVIDTDWRSATGGSGIGYDINTDLFPDMAAFLEQCEEIGVGICFNDHPEPIVGTTNSLDKTEVAYRDTKLTLILSMGLDYWWYDRNWSVSLNPIDKDVSVYAFGMYAYQWVTQEYLESITDLDEFAKRALIMANVDGVLHGKWTYASDLSAHRYSIQWTGDIGAESVDLAQEIYTSVFGGAEVGLPYMSSDIGGHNESVTDSMYARWIQYGALSTICRVHCTNEKYIHQDGRMPWLFGETAEEVAHTYLDMRYRLLPLFYSLARENYDDGLPIMRRLDILYPEYVESSRNDEYLLGDYILVAPLNEAVVDVMVPNENLTHKNANGQTVTGLKAEYYNNNSFSGTPSVTRVDSNIYYDWTTSGPNGLGNDNFSIKWTGNITIGDKDAALSFFSDDGIEVWIDGVKVVNGADTYDTLFTTPTYKANSTHSIEVKYVELGGNAHIYMHYLEQKETSDSTCYNTRDVFIPDGTWIDVWSGERFIGPKTYTVTHPLETSPIFVREGALVALAPNMKNTSEKDWSEMVLDVYPSTNYNANIILYEDDTITTAYKEGYYRTTDISMHYDNNLFIKINKAVGEFEGARAFTERLWTVRLHTNPGWGEVVRITLNGVEVDFDLIPQSDDGVPFAFSGPSRDGDIVEFKVEGNVYEEYEIEVVYDKTVDSSKNDDYKTVEIPFELSYDEAGDAVDFGDNTIDWISYGEYNDDRYLTGEALDLFSKTTSYDNAWINTSSFVKILPNGSTSSTRYVSQKDFSFVITTNSDANYYVLYLGGYKSTAKVSVRDTSGNVKTINFGNIYGSYFQRVVINTTTDVEGDLYVTYSMVASEYSPVKNNSTSSSAGAVACYVTLAGGYASSMLSDVIYFDDLDVNANFTSSVDAGGNVNLTEVGDLDWMHFGSDVDVVQKNSGSVLGNVDFGSSFKFYDYKATISYSDGLEQPSNSGSTNGLCSTDSITLKMVINNDVNKIILYTGAWNATNTIEVLNHKGEVIATSTSFKAGNTSINKVVSININVQTSSVITIRIKSNDGDTGNVSLVAVAVSSADNDNDEGHTLQINHLNLDGSLIEEEVINDISFTYTVYAKEYSGLVPSHDYIIVEQPTENIAVNFYYSQIDVWNGSDVNASLSGSGTESDPYLITSGADLKWLDNNMSKTDNFSGVYFKMTKSIDLNGYSIKIGEYPGWSGRKIFSGIFDGNNCSIRNLNMTESGMGAGLFSVVSGTVKNLTVYGNVKGNDKMTGGIVGWLYKGNLEKCSNYVNVTSTGSSETGAIIGTSELGTVINCTNYGSVTGKDSVGGVAGKASGKLLNCRNYASVNGTANVGDIYGSSHSTGTPVLESFFVNDGSITDPIDYDYSFAIIGDTQCMVQHARENNSDENLKKIYDYVLDNATSKNIEHVFHLGDIVQITYTPNYTPSYTEENKVKMYKEIEYSYKQIGRMDGVLDYSLVRGNHEPVELYEEYFGVNSTYTNYASQIEDYYVNSTNSIHYFSAGNLDYMVVTLDFGAGDPVLEWANEQIAAHPNHNVIVVTHAYMYRDGSLLNDNHGISPYRNGVNDSLYNIAMGDIANNGDDIWNKLIKKHANIVMVLCGHDSTEDVVVSQLIGDNGNVITNILIDPQYMDTQYKSQGGVGAVAMFYFSNDGKDVTIRYWSTVQNAYIKTANQFKITINTVLKK